MIYSSMRNWLDMTWRCCRRRGRLYIFDEPTTGLVAGVGIWSTAPFAKPKSSKKMSPFFGELQVRWLDLAMQDPERGMIAPLPVQELAG